MRFLNKWKNKLWIALITHRAYIVNNLRVKMLIIMNILNQKKIDLMLFSKITYFKACNINISIEITSKDSYTKQSIYIKAEVYISSSECVSIDVSHLNLSIN